MTIATTRGGEWVPGSGGIERPRLRLGFIALNDCAPLVIAKERGFFRQHGLQVTLERQPSWATLRDQLAAGLLDGAHILAPLPLAATLGLGARALPMVVALSLGANGNAITVSLPLYERMRALDPGEVMTRPVSARALARVVAERRAAGRPPLLFGVVFPFSAHNYQLRYWLAAGGVDPDRDVGIVVVPPSATVGMLERGSIDAYCVGEPWNHYAAQVGVGRTAVTGYEIWNNAPEKVLAVTRAWAALHPATHRALVRALLDAARWLDAPAHRLEAVHVIAGESYVDAPVEVVGHAMLPTSVAGSDTLRLRPEATTFFRHAATFPWRSHASWFVAQMLRWGQLTRPVCIRDVAAAVYRPDVYRAAAADLGVAVPTVDEKREGVHTEPWTLTAASAPIPMGPDAFIDGRHFDARDPLSYLASFEVRAPSLDLARLAERNPA
jgi:nitrate/nitrite transport system substrate-binding protein